MANNKKRGGNQRKGAVKSRPQIKADPKPFKAVRRDHFGGSLAVKAEEGRSRATPAQTDPAPKLDEFMVARRYLSRDGLVDVDTVTAEFGVTKAALAQSLGFAEETLQRFSRVAAPKTQQRLREMLEILTRVEPWAGGMPQALGWYRGQSIPALGDQTAEALVKNDQAGMVRAYLDGFAAGSYA